jgi:hypothetical protein
LPNIERRTRNLRGTHSLGAASGGGALVRVWVPLSESGQSGSGAPGQSANIDPV